MPKLDKRWHPRKEPTLQIPILKSIAMSGIFSQKQAIAKFGFKASTISDAFKVLEVQKHLIARCKKPPDIESGISGEKFYKLSEEGLIAFINGNPSPYEFWTTIMKYCEFNAKAIDETPFDNYYSMFIRQFIGESFHLQSCFFLSDSFDRVFEKWKGEFNNRYQASNNAYCFQHNPDHAYKVIECLSQNRAITIEQIAALTNLAEHDIRNVLNDYSMTQSGYHHFIDLYDSVYKSDRSVNTTTNFLNHLVIIPTREKDAEITEDPKFELSLIGVLLMMGTISLRRKQGTEKIPPSTFEYYDNVPSNYQDKLPLIFGKWKLLNQILDFDTIPSIFDYLFLHKSEILSLSNVLGGNKEIYDNIKSAALSTINKFFTVYDDGISALESGNYSKEFSRSKHYRFIQSKLNEIEILLRYSDLESFAEYMKSKRKLNSTLLYLPDNIHLKDLHGLTYGEMYAQYAYNTQERPDSFREDLKFIENALAEEFTLLFYIGLLRENNHKASDYPLTRGFVTNPSLVNPKDFLLRIIKSNDMIRKQVLEWIREATVHQSLALEKMNQICIELERK